jgi:hypothetical protein
VRAIFFFFFGGGDNKIILPQNHVKSKTFLIPKTTNARAGPCDVRDVRRAALGCGVRARVAHSAVWDYDRPDAAVPVRYGAALARPGVCRMGPVAPQFCLLTTQNGENAFYLHPFEFD